MAISTGGFQVGGIVSGLDTDQIVERLLEVERVGLGQLEEREAKGNLELTTWRALNARLLALDTSLARLEKGELAAGRQAVSSRPELLAVKASAGPDLGAYALTVEATSRQHQVISQGYASVTDAVGGGTVEIQVGPAVFSPLQIPEGTTLEELRDAVNAARVAVTASILDRGEAAGSQRFSLVLNSKTSGTAGQIGLTLDLSGGVPPVFSDLQAAQDAHLRVGALDVYSSTNTVSGLIPGVTLELLAEAPGEAVELRLEADRGPLRSALEKVLESYNRLADFFAEQFAFEPATGQSGTLFGDVSLLGLQNQLVDAVTQPRPEAGTYRTLAQAGITLDRAGHLSITDEQALAQALEAPDELMELLTGSHGVVPRLREQIGAATEVGTGLVAQKEDFLGETLQGFADRRLELLRRVDSQELLLRRQFSQMERVLSTLQSQSAKLAAQVQAFLAPAREGKESS